MEEYDREEARVVRLLRIVIAIAIGCGVLAIALGYSHVTVIERDYSDHLERAGGDELTIWVVVMLLPAVLAYRSPRWPQLVIWILWLTSWLMLGGLVAIGDWRPVEFVSPDTTRPLIALVVIAMAGVVVVVMPLVRRMHKSPPLPKPPKLPRARVIATHRPSSDR